MKAHLLILIFFLSITLIGCQKKKAAIHTQYGTQIADPYIKSFWNKNIRYQVKENLFGGHDTVMFDRQGNITEVHAIGNLFEKMAYDQNHLLTRYRVGGDGPENSLVQYDSNLNVLTQRWIRIMGFKWDYLPDDINRLRTYYIIYILDNENRLTKEINIKNGFVSDYKYEAGVLSRKDKYILNSKELSETWKYFYEDEGIKRIEGYYRGDVVSTTPDLIHYFNKERLDSTKRIYSDSVTHTEKYIYIYF